MGSKKQKPKKPAVAVNAVVEKKPTSTVIPSNVFFKRHPAWRFSRSRKFNNSEFGWNAFEEKMFYIIERLHDIEQQTWADIFRDKKKHHPIPVSDIISEARQMLSDAKEDDIDSVFSLHLTSTERIFGLIEPNTGVLDIIWWDPEHKICPSHKKHT